MQGTNTEEPLYSAHQIRVPDELPDIMKLYAKHIIRTGPKDIIEASAEYFTNLLTNRPAGDYSSKSTSSNNYPSSPNNNNSSATAAPASAAAKSPQGKKEESPAPVAQPANVTTVMVESEGAHVTVNFADLYKKLHELNQETVPRDTIKSLADEFSIDHGTTSDILNLLGNPEIVNWLHFWCYLIANTVATADLALLEIFEAMATGDEAPTKEFNEAFKFLITKDHENFYDLELVSSQILECGDHITREQVKVMFEKKD